LNSDLSKYLRPIAIHTVDKTVEAAFHETLPIVGLMWHPERNSDKFDKQIISSIFKKTVFQNNLS
jgi:gamma-glutamyl-gamma-aminobutyrate hydrolase PuuD